MIPDPAGDVGYSFDPTTDLVRLGVAWDGALTVSATYKGPPQSARLDLLVSEAAADETDVTVEDCDPDMADSLTVTADNQRAVLEVPNVDGRLTADPQWNGTTVAYTFSSPTLTQVFAPGARDPFVCASGSADGDTFYGPFAGKTLKLTPASSVRGLKAILARKYRERFTKSTSVTVRCPKEGIAPASEPSSSGPGQAAQAFCAFSFQQGRTYRMGSATVYLASGVASPISLSSHVYPLALKYCGIYDGRWHAPPAFGAVVEAWAQRVPCAVARRIALKWNGRSSFQGYRCVATKRGYEYTAARCTKPGGRIIRFAGGA